MNRHSLCRNCSEPTTGNYCSNCGQSATAGNTNWKFLAASLVSVFVGKYISGSKGEVRRYGIPETIWAVFTRPATTVGEYLEGRHQKYYPPITIFITLSGFYLLLAGLTGQYGGQPDNWFEADATTYFNQLNDYLKYHPSVRILLQLPFMALASKLLTQKSLGFNYVKHLYLWIFVYIVNYTLSLMLMGVDYYLLPINDDLLAVINLGTRFAYGLVILRTLMHRSWFFTTGKLLLIWIISIIMTFCAFALFQVGAACAYYLMTPGEFGTILDQIMFSE